jgi:ClpX C4-type zinc finger
VKDAPPPVLNSARVLSYASVADLPYRQWGKLFVGGRLVEKVPRLAISSNLAGDIEPMLFHCDERWQVIATSGAETVEAIKSRAEKNYPGVSARWIDLNVPPEQALLHYDEQSGGLKCSFCGRRPFEVEGLVEGTGVSICRSCIEDFYRAFQPPRDAQDSCGS